MTEKEKKDYIVKSFKKNLQAKIDFMKLAAFQPIHEECKNDPEVKNLLLRLQMHTKELATNLKNAIAETELDFNLPTHTEKKIIPSEEVKGRKDEHMEAILAHSTEIMTAVIRKSETKSIKYPEANQGGTMEFDIRENERPGYYEFTIKHRCGVESKKDLINMIVHKDELKRVFNLLSDKINKDRNVVSNTSYTSNSTYSNPNYKVTTIDTRETNDWESIEGSNDNKE